MKKNIVYWGTFFLTTILMIVALYARLDFIEVCPTDEATHGINAYEMIQNGNFWINTLRYEVDYYNTKPPLMLWLIILGYKMFGYNVLGMRFFSALAGLLIYFVVFCWVYKERGKKQAILFAAFLPACSDFFQFHMMRAGDMDSVYTFFFVISVMGLYYARKKLPYLLIYGFGFGLAFMTKSSHAATMIGIGILFIPFLVSVYGKSKTIIWYFYTFLLSGLMILPWAVIRYRFDGIKFFADILLDETIGRVQGNAKQEELIYYFSYIINMIKEPVCLISMVLIVTAVVTMMVGRVKRNGGKVYMGSLKDFVLHEFDKYIHIYLLGSWFIVVVGIYSITKAGLEWYVYSAYIALMLLGVEAASYISDRIKKKQVNVVFYSSMMIISMIVSIRLIATYQWSGHGGSPLKNMEQSFINVKESGVYDFSKKALYIENGYNKEFEPYRWQHEYMFYGITILDALCKDGGVQAFLETDDRNACLVLDKTLWETYAPVLTGYVILEDSIEYDRVKD